MADAAPLSVRAYARHRGVSHQAVLRAIARGRLRECLVLVGDVPKIADVELADREWATRTDLSRAPDAVKARELDRGSDESRKQAAADPLDEGIGPGAPADLASGHGDAANLATASAREKHWRAELAELNYKQRAGEIVNAAEMQAAMEDTFSTVRTKLLGLPSKARQQLPHLTLPDLATLEDIVREALDALAAPDEPAP